MKDHDLLRLMVAVMHATRFDRQGFGESGAVQADIDAAVLIFKKTKSVKL